MHPDEDAQEVMDTLKSVAVLLGVPFAEGRDTFGRRFLDIDVKGMQYMHEMAQEMGHVEVAGHLRQMLARAKRVEGYEKGTR